MLNAEKSRYSSGLKPRRGKAVYKLFLILAIIAAGYTNLYAQEKVDIKLKQPPPNKLGVGDMWNLELTNTTDKDIKIFLTGTATEEKDGLIIEGKSKVFTLKPGRSNYKYNDFSSAEVKYNNGKYKEIILRTGNAPEGSYTICVTAFDEGGTEVGRENCIMQSVQQMGSITLLTPGDGEEVDSKQPIMFSWTPLQGAKEYTLRIVEIRGQQSHDDAIKTNKPIFEKEGIGTPGYQYGTADPKLEAGMKYAWRVSSGDVVSDVWTFSMSSSCFTLEIVDSISCNPNKANEYNVKIIFHNNSSSLTNCTMTVNSVTVSGFTFSPPISIPFTLAPGATQTYVGTLTGTGSGSTIITNATSSAGLTQNMPNQFTVPKCNCCLGFVKRLENVNISNDSLGNINLIASITAGPNPITKVTAELVYFYQNWNDTLCKKCVNGSKLTGNFTGGTLGGFGTGNLRAPFTTGFSREVNFSSVTPINMNSGQPITLNLALPPQSSLSCCADTLRLCVRFTFTDTACVTCDTVICRRMIRTSTGISVGAGGNKSEQRENSGYIEYGLNSLEGEKLSLNKPIDIAGCGISGTVYHDVNGNGVYNPGTDLPLAGRTVTCVSTDNVISLTRITNASGYFSFQNSAGSPELGTVFPKTYIITHTTPPAGWTETQPGTSNYSVVINNLGQMVPNRNFGYSDSLASGKPDCCDNFKNNVNLSISQLDNNNPFIYEIKSNIVAGPNKIRKVRAFVSYMDLKSSNPDCERCSTPSPIFNGSLLPTLFSTGSNIPGLAGPTITFSGPLSLEFSNPREMIWGSDDGIGANLTGGVNHKLWLIVPAPSSIKCCADTINVCIKYTFTDTTCITCDTVVCTKIIRKPQKTSVPFDPKKEMKKLEKDYKKYFDKMKKEERKGSSYNFNENNSEFSENTVDYLIGSALSTQTYQGESAGLLMIDLAETSNVKLILYDDSGNEVMKIFDDYLTHGQYTLDLNKYNLTGGEYLYSIESNGMVKYEKILIPNISSGCSCGK